jgi:hypothetical protein
VNLAHHHAGVSWTPSQVALYVIVAELEPSRVEAHGIKSGHSLSLPNLNTLEMSFSRLILEKFLGYAVFLGILGFRACGCPSAGYLGVASTTISPVYQLNTSLGFPSPRTTGSKAPPFHETAIPPPTIFLSKGHQRIQEVHHRRSCLDRTLSSRSGHLPIQPYRRCFRYQTCFIKDDTQFKKR